MAARSIASLTITFGLVAIPVKLYSATKSESSFSFSSIGVSMNGWMGSFSLTDEHAGCGNLMSRITLEDALAALAGAERDAGRNGPDGSGAGTVRPKASASFRRKRTAARPWPRR